MHELAYQPAQPLTAHYPARARRLQDAAVRIAATATVITVTALFTWIVIDLARRGAANLSWSFLTTPPADAGRAGGIAPILISTTLILTVCMAACVPVGLGTAVLLAEFVPTQSKFAALVRYSLDVLAGVPSIVFGLFGNAFFCVYLGMGFSILSGGLTLACMALPIFIRAAEQGLRAVPHYDRLAAAALGFSKTRSLFRVLLPAAAPGLVVGLALGVGRAIAETAALLFTSGYVDRTPTSLMDSGRALSIHIYDLAMNVPGGEPNAFASAIVLVAALLLINQTVKAVSDRTLQRHHQPA